MPKRLLIAIAVIIFFFLLIAGLHKQVAAFLNHFMGLNGDDLDVLEKRLSVIGNSVAILTAVTTGLGFLIKKFRASQPDDRVPPLPSSRELLKAYYQKLHDICESIELSLVDAKFIEFARSVKNAITLPVVYMEMDVLPYRPAKEDTDGGGRMHLRGEERKTTLQAIAEDKYRRVVVLGDPGSGKSMFVDNLAWLVAGTHLGQIDGRLPPVLRHLPVVRVRLRSAAWSCRQDGFNLVQAMRNDMVALLGEAQGEACWAVLEPEVLERGLILLDGLDEVPEAENMRTDTLAAIDALVKKLGPQARLVITSRPYVFEGKQRSWLDAFACLELQAMDNGQVERFIEHWYLLLREVRQRSEEEARGKAHELFVELQERDYLLDPARRPLILTLLASLHLAYEMLPHSRAKLYEEAIALMLERWTQRIYRDNPDYPLEEYERKILKESDATRKTALQRLALQANRDKTLQIADWKIKGLFSDCLPEDCNASNLLDFIRYRSGILKPGLGKHFEFYHRSFQDYLAALEITEKPEWQDDIEALLRKEGKDWWGEVFLLLVSAKVAGNSKPEAVSLLSRFVPEVLDYAHYPEAEWQWLFLSARAVIEQQKPLQSYASPHYAKLRRLLTAHLRCLVEDGHGLPVELRAEAGRLLGELGDPRAGVNVLIGDDGKPLLFDIDGQQARLPEFDWVPVPGGRFMMGSEDEDGEAYATEKPAHPVDVGAFQISRYLVTNAQFACFVKAGGYEDERYWLKPKAALDWLRSGKADLSLLDDNPDWKKSYENWLAQEKTRRQPWFWEQRKRNNPNHPVAGVSWYEALAFCNWLNASGHYPGEIRLPSEAEWEYAARGRSGLIYSWGGNPDPALGNYAETQLGRTSAVGLFPPGKAFGLCDMSGNVWEWTSSRWGKRANDPDFTYADWDRQNAQRDNLEEVESRFIRGGSWFSQSGDVRCAVRDWYPPSYRGGDLGFRLLCGVLPGDF